MSNSNEFDRFRKSDLAPLRRLEAGQQFTARKVGYHLYEPEGKQPLPVLDFQDEHGEPFSFMSGSWRYLDALAEASPQDGDWVTIRRLPDRGSSHNYEVHTGAKGAGDSELAF